MADRKVRVRFAPSPTGALHIGGVRTALYNYLFARQHGGELVFRIEDTDSHRFVPGAEEYILESFKWLGIQFDEGVSFGGEHGPYRQSERRDIYKQYVQQLLDIFFGSRHETMRICILNTEHQLTSMLASKQIIIQSGTNTANVQCTRWTRGKTHPYFSICHVFL
jgi:hypothetical protein